MELKIILLIILYTELYLNRHFYVFFTVQLYTVYFIILQRITDFSLARFYNCN